MSRRQDKHTSDEDRAREIFATFDPSDLSVDLEPQLVLPDNSADHTADIRPAGAVVPKTADVVYDVIDYIAKGMSVRRACYVCGISGPAFYNHIARSNDEKLKADLAAAKEAGVDRMADEIIDIADAPVRVAPDGRIDTGAVQKQKLQIDTRKWLMSKLSPKRYGDSMVIAGDADNPITIAKIERVVIESAVKTKQNNDGGLDIEDGELV